MNVGRNQEGVATYISMSMPDDWHVHYRDGNMLRMVTPLVRKRFWHTLAMPNLDPPIVTNERASAYKEAIHTSSPDEHDMYNKPTHVSLYLAETLDPQEVANAPEHVKAIKYYPAGLTTNSEKGITDPSALWTRGTRAHEVLCAAAEKKIVVCLHAADGKNAHGVELDPYDQEPHFMAESLPRIRDAHPKLKISAEHLSTKQGADYMLKHGGPLLGCSLTAHHLLLDRRDVFRGGFRPHRSWMPAIQSIEHTEALRDLAGKGLPFVWLGSDSAPHSQAKKESDCCASGVMMAHAGIELYAEAFDNMNALDDRFENFACRNGARFFNVTDGHKDKKRPSIHLQRLKWKVRKPFMVWNDTDELQHYDVVPFRLGEEIEWTLS
ncbi:MAG: dihydroorotase [Candidatus Adlerbacteria bacterium]|nr:dihydroorotase [Candidatus Adlerbacteria bacterium]